MAQANSIHRAWLITWVIALVCFAAATVVGFGLWIVTGLIVLGWGLAWVVNWRGTADAMIARGRSNTMVFMQYGRPVFGCFALFGAGLLIVGIVALAR